MLFVKNERSGYFVQQNRGKLSLCLDPRSEDNKIRAAATPDGIQSADGVTG
jgi:hypothetical protein